jgi:hypothetical protein
MTYETANMPELFPINDVSSKPQLELFEPEEIEGDAALIEAAKKEINRIYSVLGISKRNLVKLKILEGLIEEARA